MLHNIQVLFLLALMVCSSSESLKVGTTHPLKHFQSRTPLLVSTSVADTLMSDLTAKFPYGECCFRTIVAEGSFLVDKTAYIRTLEDAGKYNQIWRPRRFGKSLVCRMLAEYYDAANSKDQLRDTFGHTDIMMKDLATEEMGKYLVLRLSFSGVSTDGDGRASFRDAINKAAKLFSEKYHDIGLLNVPVEISPTNELVTLRRLFDLVTLSGQQIYLIVDECDAFVHRLLLSVDTRQPDLGLAQYKRDVADKEQMLRHWGNVIKAGTVDATIARAFITGVVPFAFSDGLSSMNMVQDLTFDPAFEGMFGLTVEDISGGLGMITHLTADQRAQYLEQMRKLYEGYRFVRTQKEPVYNPQYVLYFLSHLEQHGAPPDSLIDHTVSGPVDSLAQYLIANYKSNAPYTLLNFALGIVKPEEMDWFLSEANPSFHSNKLFQANRVSDSLIALAFFHGFLTYKDQCTVLTCPNAVMQAVFLRALFNGLPRQRMQELEAMLRSGKPDVAELERIVRLGIEEAQSGVELSRALAKVLGVVASTDVDHWQDRLSG